MNKWLPLIACLIVLPCASAVAQTDEDATAQVQAWSPRPVPRELVDKVINGNLFVPNQRVEPRVQPPPGEANGETQPDVNAPPAVEPEPEPENPDRRFRLVGTSAETGRWLAFIENTQTREVLRVTVDQEVASGAVTMIDYNRIEYTTDGQATSVLIGRDLTGELPRAPLNDRMDNLFAPQSTASGTPNAPEASDADSSGNNNPTSAPPSDADAQRAEVLRRLRERRQRDSQ